MLNAAARVGIEGDLLRKESGRDGVGWRPRHASALAVRVVAYGVPVLAATAAGRAVAELDTGAPLVVRTLLGLTVAILASLLVSSLTMRLLPLAVLLKMTMIFPDQAPSRHKVARAAGGVNDLQRRLASPDRDEQKAATLMLSLVTALGRHDRRTRGHSERVRLFGDLLATELGLDAAAAGRLRWAALVHDIGKLEVPVAVLAKRGTLNATEWGLIRLHPLDGARLAAPLEAWLGPWFAGIEQHHERFDGTGYPRGLSGEDICVAGRAIAVVDAFETMTAARSYKSARSMSAARVELARCAGSHFDPVMVRAFLAISLLRLLWSVGPLAFVLNVPFLRWVGEGGGRLVDVAGSTVAGATQAAGAAAVAVAIGAVPVPAALAVGAMNGYSTPSVHVVTGSTVARPARNVLPTTNEIKTLSTSPKSRVTKAPTAKATKSPTAKVAKAVSKVPTAKVAKAPTAKATKALAKVPTAKATKAPTAEVGKVPTAKVAKAATKVVSNKATAEATTKPVQR